MKKMLLLLIIVSVLVLVVGCADLDSDVVGQAGKGKGGGGGTVATCDDLDNSGDLGGFAGVHQSFFEASSVTHVNKGGDVKVWNDECNSHVELKERYCSGDNFDTVSVICANGCSNGECVGTCTDGFVNQDETDIDCGGATCGVTCDDGKACVAASDCMSSVCDGGVCQVPRCGDGVLHTGEACDDGNTVNDDACSNSCVVNKPDLTLADSFFALWPGTTQTSTATTNDRPQHNYWYKNDGTRTLDIAALGLQYTLVDLFVYKKDGVEFYRTQFPLYSDVTNLAVGEVSGLEKGASIPNLITNYVDPSVLASFSPGRYCVDVFLDVNDVLDELDENNDFIDVSCIDVVAATTCTDGIQNQDETGVDCGGATCGACATAPDLIVEEAYFTTSTTWPRVKLNHGDNVSINQNVEMWVKVKNVGTADVIVPFDTNTTLFSATPGFYNYGTFVWPGYYLNDTGPLAVGQSKEYAVHGFQPPRYSEYCMQSVTDISDVVAELDENNNKFGLVQRGSPGYICINVQ